MELKRTFRSGVVLLELMASILIFALAGAVCVQVLMKADEVSRQSRQLEDGIRYVSSAAEILRWADSPEEAEEALVCAWPETVLGDTTVIPFPEGELRITLEESGLHTYDIHYLADGERVYSLEICRSWEVTP